MSELLTCDLCRTTRACPLAKLDNRRRAGGSAALGEPDRLYLNTTSSAATCLAERISRARRLPPLAPNDDARDTAEKTGQFRSGRFSLSGSCT